MFMVMFVIDDPNYLDQILAAWSGAGITGATIVESSGLYRHQKRVPMRYIYGDAPLEEKGNLTLFVIVRDERGVQLCLEEVEKIVGDLDGPNTGVFAAWPLAHVKGVPARGTI